MLLAFDVGNTDTVLGVFRGHDLVRNWRISTETNKSADEYGMLVGQLFAYENISMEDVDDVIISTVVPSLMFTLQHMAVILLFTLLQSFSITGGNKSSDIVGIFVGIVLNTKDTPSICKKTFERKR